MLDLGHLPNPNDTNKVDIFVGNTTVAGTGWQTWVKPKGKTMAHILLIGAGGNGGGSGAGTNAGGGGGSGAQVSLIIPLSLVGDALYLSLSIGNSATTGSVANTVSYITTYPALVTANVLAYTYAGGAGGPGGAALGGAGAAGIASVIASMPIGAPYVDSMLIGQVGTVGSAANGVNLVIPGTGLFVTGGTGGANNTGTSGGITGAGIFPSISGSLSATSGSNGMQPISKLMFFYGGTGGGGSNNAIGNPGGNGAYGCGGGGGSGSTGATNGVGGQGGPALCIITSW